MIARLNVLLRSLLHPDVPAEQQAELERALERNREAAQAADAALARNKRATNVLIEATKGLVHAENGLRHKLENRHELAGEGL